MTTPPNVVVTTGAGLCPHGAGGTRTHDLRFRKPSLYPAELQPHHASLWGLKAGEVIATTPKPCA